MILSPDFRMRENLMIFPPRNEATLQVIISFRPSVRLSFRLSVPFLGSPIGSDFSPYCNSGAILQGLPFPIESCLGPFVRGDETRRDMTQHDNT